MKKNTINNPLWLGSSCWTEERGFFVNIYNREQREDNHDKLVVTVLGDSHEDARAQAVLRANKIFAAMIPNDCLIKSVEYDVTVTVATTTN